MSWDAIPKKVFAVLPLDVLLPQQSQISFVHERRRLQRVVRALVPQIASRELSQLLIDERYQLVDRALPAFLPGVEKLGDLRWIFALVRLVSVQFSSLVVLRGGAFLTYLSSHTFISQSVCMTDSLA